METKNMETEDQSLTENPLAPSRLKIVNNLCQFTPFFLFPIVSKVVGEDMDRWWIMLIAIVVVVCVGALYLTIFRRVFMPKNVTQSLLTKGEKIFYYSMMLICPVLTIVVYSLMPFSQLINSILALLVNFGLTMILCYTVSTK